MLAAALAAALALPHAGVFIPGERLGGVRLGAPEAAVRAAWGPRAGVCRSCAHRTLYFTYGRFDQTGAGVELRRGRTVALFTLWLPTGWRTEGGLRLGDGTRELERLHGLLPRVDCGHYHARVRRSIDTTSAFYFKGDVLWAFGLLRRSVPVCR